MSSYGDLYDDAMQDVWLEGLYLEHADQAVKEFRSERLKSYYSANLEMADAPYAVLADARALRTISSPASIVRATTASELGVKNLLLRPIVHGLVHSESLATVIADLVMSHAAVDRYRDLLVGILDEYGGFDLNTYVRPGGGEVLWAELARSQKARNGVVHRGVNPAEADVDMAIGIAETVLERLFPQVVSRLGFHFHGSRLCEELHASEEIDKLRQALASRSDIGHSLPREQPS